MESGTFRKWLLEHGCRIDGDRHPTGHEGPVTVVVHREGKTTQVAFGSPRHNLDPRAVHAACEALGLDPSELPGPQSRV